MDFRVLGPVELWVGGQRHPLGTAKERCVLAALLLAAGRPVSADALIDRVWGERTPSHVRASLHSYVARLRSRLQALGEEGVRLRFRSGAYALEVDPHAVDLHTFRTLVDQARAMAGSGEDEAALALYRRAGRLWREQPLADLSGEWVMRTRQAIKGELLDAAVDRIEIELHLGHHSHVVRELWDLTAQEPYDERPLRQLMLALYRCGRHADAVAAYHDARERLWEELGAGIGTDLRELHHRIVARDPDLLLAARPTRPAPDPVDTLPRDVHTFVGREAEIRRVTADPHGTSIIAIDGMPGSGKTALGIHLAHGLAPQYPDARLFLDMLAYDADRPPLPPESALDTLLRALHVSPDRIPPDLDDRAALWRAELANRRALIVLDNVLGHDRIRPLLPGSRGSLVIVTSRRRPAGLDDVRTLSLGELAPAEAATLFRRIAGLPDDRAEEADVATVVRRCGHLPLAVRLAANRLRHRTAWTAGDLATRLAHSRSLLGEIRAEDREITTAFGLSYLGLAPLRRREFRRLSLHPGADFDVYAAAAITQTGREEAERALDELYEHNLLDELRIGRFRLHDLLREYGRELARREDTEEERRRAVQALFAYYSHVADHADRIGYPHLHRRRAAPESTAAPDAVPQLATEQQAREWFRTEADNLIRTADRGWPDHTASIASALAGHLEDEGHWDEATHLHEQGIAAGRLADDPAATATALHDLSVVLYRSGHYDDALDNAERALRLRQSGQDRRGEAALWDLIGLINWHRSEFAKALRSCERALAMYDQLHDERGQADARSHTALILFNHGRYEEARETLRRALASYRECGDRRGQTIVLNNLGDVELRMGNRVMARYRYEEAASASPEMSRQHQAIWSNNIANLHAATGLHFEALADYRKALATYREIGDRQSEADTLNSIGTAYGRMGRHGEALIHHQRALTIARDISARYEVVRALCGVGEAQGAMGRYAIALDHFRRAHDLAERIGDPYGQAKALEGLGLVRLRSGGAATARAPLQMALALYESLGVPEASTLLSHLNGRDYAAGAK